MNKPLHWLDFDYDPKTDPNTVDKAVEWLKKEGSNFCGTANFAVFSSDGTHKEKFGAACHWDIGNALNIPAGYRDCVATEIQQTGERKPEFQRGGGDFELFLQWLIHSSVFTPYILNRDDSKSLKKGIVISSDIPTQLLQNLCIIGRYTTEAHAGAFEAFRFFVEKGFLPEVAFSIAFHTPTRNQSVFDPKVRNIYNYTSHCAWGLWGNTKAFNNFVNRKFVGLIPKQTYRQIASIMGGSKLCYEKGTTPPQSTSCPTFINQLLTFDDFRKELSKFRKEDTSAPVIVNPFAPRTTVTVRPEHSSCIEMAEFILPYLNEKGLVNVYAHQFG
ncbi:hypothetical protein KGP36_03065 [Patescibacteria group bacterium]|nr:hypothetical protein [Patescibacteria group bacterium]